VSDEMGPSQGSWALKKQVSLILAIATGVIAVVGCGGSGAASTAGPEPPSRLQQEQQKVDVFNRLQEAVELCMRAEGFDFRPAAAEATGFTLPVEALALESSEFASRYGWGFATLFYKPTVSTGADDPNREIMESMTGEERAAWTQAFVSCQKAAGETAAIEARALSDSERALRGALQRFDADPRVIKAHETWSSCMAEQGYEFEDPPAVAEAVRLEVLEAQRQFEDRMTADNPGMAGLEIIQAFLESSEYQDTVEREISVAIASLEICGYPPPIIERTDELATIHAEYYRSALEETG